MTAPRGLALVAMLAVWLAVPVAAQDTELTQGGANVAARQSEDIWSQYGDAFPEVREALIVRWNAIAVAESVEGQPVPARVWRKFERNMRTLEQAILKKVAELEGARK